MNETTVRLQELPYLLTNISLTVLGNQAHSQKWYRRFNWDPAFLSLALLAQLGFDCLPTSKVKGIPSRRHRLRMDQRNF